MPPEGMAWFFSNNQAKRRSNMANRVTFSLKEADKGLIKRINRKSEKLGIPTNNLSALIAGLLKNLERDLDNMAKQRNQDAEWLLRNLTKQIGAADPEIILSQVIQMLDKSGKFDLIQAKIKQAKEDKGE
jgi:hypothetical protein